MWIDCEMTGLELAKDKLIEIAALVTDSELNVLGEGVDVVIHADDASLACMPPVVQDMHATSGLTEEVRASTVSVARAEEIVLDYLREHVPTAGTAPLAGNTIGTDRGFIARDMPELDGFMHYRVIDVSSIKELCRRWYPRIYFGKPEKGLAHRALADIRESIDELRFYRRTAFVPAPGPTSEDVAAVTAEMIAERTVPATGERTGERTGPATGDDGPAAGDDGPATGSAGSATAEVDSPGAD